VALDLAFDLDLPHGRCVGVRIPGELAAVESLVAGCLLAEEMSFAATLGPRRRRTWLAGRMALREALARAGLTAPRPVLGDDRGAPGFAGGVCGSVSHKEQLAVALVAADVGPRVGVDVEIEPPDPTRKQDIARRVLTEAEMLEIVDLDPAARALEVLVRFSAKEAIYKALDPFVRRFVGFGEVSVTPLAGGGARVVPALKAGEGPFAIEVGWRRFEGIVLTTARVSRG
jgi:enterobactin synthetase component D